MPNALVQPYTAGVQAAASAPLYDPRLAREHRSRFRRDEIPELDLANSYYNPIGRYPGRGWVLLRRKDYNAFNKYATNLQLQISDFTHNLTLSGLSIVQARCVTRGIAQDDNAIYLVELTDARGILWNRYFAFPTTSQYNMRSPAYPEQFYTQSMNGGVPWTWNTLVGDLWAQMGAFLGPYPGLPVSPTDEPEGWSFPGTSAWLALNQILDSLGCSVICDLQSATPYSLINLQETISDFERQQALYAGLLEDDFEWIDAGSGRLPKQVTVYFHKRYQYYGTEETVRRDSLQWSSTPYYAVTIPTPYSSASGTHFLWYDFTVRYNVDGQPLAADVAAAQVNAQDTVNQWLNYVNFGTAGYMRQVYIGCLPFTQESVRWRQTFPPETATMGRPGPISARDGYQRTGWTTEVVRYAEAPWEEVEVDRAFRR